MLPAPFTNRQGFDWTGWTPADQWGGNTYTLGGGMGGVQPIIGSDSPANPDGLDEVIQTLTPPVTTPVTTTPATTVPTTTAPATTTPVAPNSLSNTIKKFQSEQPLMFYGLMAAAIYLLTKS